MAGKVGRGESRSGASWQVRSGVVGHGVAWQVRRGAVWRGEEGAVWQGRCGDARLVRSRYGKVRQVRRGA